MEEEDINQSISHYSIYYRIAKFLACHNNNNVDSNTTTTTVGKEDIIFEEVHNPSTLEPMIDPSTGKPRSRRVSSVDNPEEYRRLVSELQQADKRREEAKAAEEREMRDNPPVLYTKVLDVRGVPYFEEYRKTAFGKYVQTSSVNTSVSTTSPAGGVFQGKYRCPYCSNSSYTEEERSRHMNSHYARSPRS
jgi:hypothetical protein